MSNQERRLIGSGINKLLGNLVCYSCQEHNRCAYEDKYFDIDSANHVSIFAGGKFELFSKSLEDLERAEILIVELNKISDKHLEKFYNGVSITFKGTKLECASCGSQEFIAPSA